VLFLERNAQNSYLRFIKKPASLADYNCLQYLSRNATTSRVARWYGFKPKIQIWENFQGLGMKKVGIGYGHLEYITTIWYSLRPFGNLVAIW
jgi:hypothetical protein